MSGALGVAEAAAARRFNDEHIAHAHLDRLGSFT